MPFCIRCNKMFVRHREKGTRRNNSKLCEKCKLSRGKRKCVVCKKKLDKKVSWQVVCSKKCRSKLDILRLAKSRKKNKTRVLGGKLEPKTIKPIRSYKGKGFQFHKEIEE